MDSVHSSIAVGTGSLAGFRDGPEERLRRVRRADRKGVAFEQVHAEQHVAHLVVAGQKVAVADIGAEAHGEQDRGQEVLRSGNTSHRRPVRYRGDANLVSHPGTSSRN